MFGKIFRFVIISIVVLLLAIMAYSWYVKQATLSTQQNETVSSAPAQPQTRIGGKFSLINQDNTPVTDEDFKGKWMLVYFGFTHCPDVCPTDVGVMSSMINFLPKEKQDKLASLFITVDPQRDTPEVIKTYLSNFSDKIIGLTGTPEQVADAVNVYRVYSQKVDDETLDDYLMNHSAYTYLMNPEGQYVKHFRHNTPVDELLKEMNKLL